MVAGRQGCWSHCIHTQKAERGRWWSSTPSLLFIEPRTPAMRWCSPPMGQCSTAVGRCSPVVGWCSSAVEWCSPPLGQCSTAVGCCSSVMEWCFPAMGGIATVGVNLPISTNIIWKVPHRCAPTPVSSGTPNRIKLTININHHGCDFLSRATPGSGL